MAARLLLFLLLAAGAARADTLARHGAFSWGDGGADALAGQSPRSQLVLDFNLVQPATVTVEVSGLRHLDRGPNAAPEAFIDEQSLGALHAQHGGYWRSPFLPALGPGKHCLLIRNAAVQDAEDFVAAQVLVYAGSLSGPAKRPAGASGQALPTPVPAVKAVIAHPRCSGHWRKTWPDELKGGVILSVLEGRQANTRALVTLKPGQSWRCEVRIPPRSGEPVPLVMGFERLTKKSGRLIFSRDPNPSAQRDDGYKPGEWEPLTVDLCDKRLIFQIGQFEPMRTFWSFSDLELQFAAEDLELGIRAAR